MKKLLLFTLVIFLFSSKPFAQASNEANKLMAWLKNWNDNHPQEKVFVQTDRDRYLAGESIWLKAWCVLDAKPTFLSKILYVVMSDEQGNVIDKKMYNLDKLASANGVFDIDKKLKSGNYTLSAFTTWMLNYPDFIFKKQLYIYNNDYKATAPNSVGNYNLVFFPEGGEMVEGAKGRIAIKATNKFGFPANVSGGIYSTTGEKIVDFASEHDGMGVFELLPVANTRYVAKVTFDNSKKQEFELPQIKKEGITLQVQNTSTARIFVLINRSETNKQKFNKFLLLAQMNGNPVYQANFNLDEGASATSIVKKNLLPGILQITIFDTTGLPIAERLVFISNHEIFQPKLSVQKRNIAGRGMNSFSFQMDSITNSSLSVLVVDNDTEKESSNKDNIATNFLLASDIKGFVNNPGYYFANKQAGTLQYLDLLLMTQGWRRFTWNQIKNEKEIALKYPVETYMNIKGKAVKSDRSTGITNGSVSFIIKGEDSTTILSNAYLTDKGEFIVDSLFFNTKATVSYEGNNNKKSTLPVDVTIYPAFVDTLKKIITKPDINLDTLLLNQQTGSMADYIKKGISNLDVINTPLLETVTVTAKKLSTIDSLQKQYVSPLFENSDQSLTIPENRSYVNIWQYLNMSIPGLNVNPFTPGGVTNVSFKRHEGMSLDDTESGFVKFLLNEIPVSADVIDGLNPPDVALIKVYKGATGFAFGADAGAISIYTKKGVSLRNAVFDKNFSKTEKIGFAYTREFYNPDYTLHPTINNLEKDNRLTLYWNPKITQTNSKEYSITFHNSDNAKAFKVIIQGINSEGKLIYLEQVLK